MSTTSRTPSLTPSRSPSPQFQPPTQPDHFYGSQDSNLPPSPNSDGKTWLNPADDPLAHRGIPVFKPTLEEFEDFEGYVSKIECWGMRSGIVKVIPPSEWTNALPSLKEQLLKVKIRTPIEQHMLGRGGLFRQENLEKRRIMSVREWAELCNKEEFRAPGVADVGLHLRSNMPVRQKQARKNKARAAETATADLEAEAPSVNPEPKDEVDSSRDNPILSHVVSPPNSTADPSTPAPDNDMEILKDTNKFENAQSEEKKSKPKRIAQTREAREASLAERSARDVAFLQVFDPHSDWLPPGTKPSDYTPDFCRELERQYWRNCGLGKPAWYGADTQGSLYTDDTKAWNIAHLPSALSRLLPASSKGLPGVNLPYLYFGMWRATFAWHVEDMDLFSINYIHFGAPKFWYAVPQGRAAALEQTMRGYFPKDTSRCPQFLRHKSFLASPTLLAQSSCRPNFLVQQPGEFVITFPRGYHAGFNLGFNCAESVNFALESWLELGKKAKACHCINDSVTIDVNQLLQDREAERLQPSTSRQRTPPGEESRLNSSKRRRTEDGGTDAKPKRLKTKPASSTSLPSSSKSKITLTLKLGPRPELETFPCCLCVSKDQQGLLRVNEPPLQRKDAVEAAGNPDVWMAHEQCATIVPETWVDDVITDGGVTERMVFGVDGIVKDRWNLKCNACSKPRSKGHGAPIQCTKGKCSKSFHISCARDGGDQNIVFAPLREVEKEVVLLNRTSSATHDGTDDGEVEILKIIRKTEVQVLCSQHNPERSAAKKASKQYKIRNGLLTLPPMSRIKIRVSAGVFEVSLVRVIEETSSVEVLWDRGIKREFKWGSVVFGNTPGQAVMQKPAEPASVLEPLPENTDINAPTKASAPTTTTSTVFPASQAAVHNTGYDTNYPTYTYGSSWLFPARTSKAVLGAQPQVYPNYYRLPSYPTYLAETPNEQPTTANQQAAQFQWQRPYTGPRRGYGMEHYPNVQPKLTEDNDMVTSETQPASTSTLPNPSYSTIQSAQIAEILRDNPKLRDAVREAMGRQTGDSSDT